MKLKVKDALPKWREGFKAINTWKDLQELGEESIGTLIDYKQNNVNNLHWQIGELEGLTELVKGKCGKYFTELAEEYDDPKIPEDTLVIRLDSLGKNLEPSRTEDINRKANSTTYNNCGWCEHTIGGSFRHNYAITTGCEFYSEAGLAIGNRGVASKGCLMTEISKESLGKFASAYQSKIKTIKGEIGNIEAIIQRMKELQNKAESRPILPNLRHYDHFNIGDRIAVYIPDSIKNFSRNGRFIEGTVIEGYRHHDGCVNFVTDKPFHTDMSCENGKGEGKGIKRAEILLKSELDQFYANPKYVQFWLRNISSNFISKDFVGYMAYHFTYGIY